MSRWQKVKGPTTTHSDNASNIMQYALEGKADMFLYAGVLKEMRDDLKRVRGACSDGGSTCMPITFHNLVIMNKLVYFLAQL